MRKNNISESFIAKRKTVWKALSELYLDTTLADGDLINIVEIFKESPYSLTEIKEIDKTEVYPVLQVNLLIVAGEWVTFEEDWLIEKITSRLQQKNFILKYTDKIYYYMFKKMNETYWKTIEEKYNK